MPAPLGTSKKNAEKLIGKRFGKLVVTGLSHFVVDKHGHEKWLVLCDCDCGTKDHPVRVYNLNSGMSKSCGCVTKQNGGLKPRSNKQQKHESKCRLYKIRQGMIDRCNNPNNKAYKNYGGRGIRVCDEWSGNDGYVNFRKWSMSNGYNDAFSIDRINNDSDYSPDNCRWVDRKTQANNTRVNLRITYKGETHTAMEWGDIYGISGHKIARRYNAGWELDEVFDEKKHIPEKGMKLTWNGETHNILTWSKKLNISKWTIRQRIKNGWSIEDILGMSGNKQD